MRYSGDIIRKGCGYLNLLIIGAGGHGHVVKEIAEDTNNFDKIDFVDDNCPDAVGKIEDLHKLHDLYDSAFVSIGNNKFREELISKLIEIGYNIPTLIHPTAYVSKSCKIGSGTVIEQRAVINANATIGNGCIISVNAVVDHDTLIGNVVHINAGAIVMSGVNVDNYVKIDAGQVVKGF